MNKEMRASDILLANYHQVIELLSNYGVKEARIFGSIYKNEDTINSDLDLIVKLSEQSTLFHYGQLKYRLETILEIPIDLLTYSSLATEVLDHFHKHSIAIENFLDFKKENRSHGQKSFDKLIPNLSSLVWVINRILESCENISKEEFMHHTILKDAVTRNMQLLSKIVSQIPLSELEEKKVEDLELLKACLVLKEALFMNVDYELLWKTVLMELKPLKDNIEKIIEGLN